MAGGRRQDPSSIVFRRRRPHSLRHRTPIVRSTASATSNPRRAGECRPAHIRLCETSQAVRAAAHTSTSITQRSAEIGRRALRADDLRTVDTRQTNGARRNRAMSRRLRRRKAHAVGRNPAFSAPTRSSRPARRRGPTLPTGRVPTQFRPMPAVCCSPTRRDLRLETMAHDQRRLRRRRPVDGRTGKLAAASATRKSKPIGAAEQSCTVHADARRDPAQPRSLL